MFSMKKTLLVSGRFPRAISFWEWRAHGRRIRSYQYFRKKSRSVVFRLNMTQLWYEAELILMILHIHFRNFCLPLMFEILQFNLFAHASILTIASMAFPNEFVNPFRRWSYSVHHKYFFVQPLQARIRGKSTLKQKRNNIIFFTTTEPNACVYYKILMMSNWSNHFCHHYSQAMNRHYLKLCFHHQPSDYLQLQFRIRSVFWTNFLT